MDAKCNYDILYAVGPAPCDKKCHPDYQNLFLGGSGIGKSTVQPGNEDTILSLYA